MAAAPRHEIADLTRRPGELSFEARLHGREPQRIWFRSGTEVEPYPEAALAAMLMPAMRTGGELTMSEPVSPRVLRMQREFQAIQRAWSHGWVFDDPALEEVEVSAPVRPVERRQPSGRVAVFFSGGVDSWSTILGEEEVTDLIFVRGLDILPIFAHQEGLAERVEARLRAAADELGLRFHSVETNARELSEPNGPGAPEIRWESYYNSLLSAVALLLGPLFDRVLISTGLAYFNQSQIGAAWMVDQLWGNENLEIADAGGVLGRVARVERIAAHPVVQKSLRVCWHNPDGAYNCGRCRKCTQTMLSLELYGALQEVETFPPDIDLDRLAGFTLDQAISLVIWEDLLDTIREQGRADLEPPVAALVEKGRRTMGLAKTYRTRPSRGGTPEALSGREQEDLEAELKTVLESRSWKLTKPMRRLGDRLRARRGA